ncbi:hypothetical protein AB9M62_22960 [Bacillales bacterium AN1005]
MLILYHENNRKGVRYLKKEYWIIVISYIAMQLSTLIGVPIVMFIGKLLGYDTANLGMAS